MIQFFSAINIPELILPKAQFTCTEGNNSPVFKPLKIMMQQDSNTNLRNPLTIIASSN